jgi:hypothetical protein
LNFLCAQDDQPPPPPCNSCGDVHIRTPDGLHYDFETYDVILIPPLAIVVGPDGLDQYDYTDVATTGELVLLSHLDVVNPLSAASTAR